MYIKLYLFSFLVSLFGAWLAMKFGHRIGINDIPNHRSSHAEIIPKGGGIGILAAFICASLVLSLPMSLWIPSIVIALVSLWGGDKHRLSVGERLFVQFACSLVFLFFFIFPKHADSITYLLSIPISIFIVGTSNFYNFMDGIDGIAGVTGVVGFLLLLQYSMIIGAGDTYGIVCLALSFSCFGFLCFNLFKTKVFLGDIGSVLLGFLFACIIVVLSKNFTDFIIMTGFLAPFYFDELTTMVVRAKNGDSLIEPHRKHLYQILANECSIRHWKISLGYGFAQTVIGLSVISLRSMGIYFILSAYLIYGLVFVLISINIRKRVRSNEN